MASIDPTWKIAKLVILLTNPGTVSERSVMQSMRSREIALRIHGMHIFEWIDSVRSGGDTIATEGVCGTANDISESVVNCGILVAAVVF
eukprot:6257559-Pyramimonas_sp.AAC.1